jgi:hypothetical protein
MNMQRLVDTVDVPALLRAVDGYCASRAWDDLVDLASRCRDAIELGRQLWPVAMHIEYRLAYEAPGPYAAGVLRPGAAKFALGPLTEVAASTHAWDELAPGIGDPASSATVAQERVIRGEDLRGRLPAEMAELPLVLQNWEPAYALPTYRDREALFPAPEIVGTAPGGSALDGTAPGGGDRLGVAGPLPADAATEALRMAVEPWTAQSEGRVATATVDGDAAAAIARLAPAAAVEPISGRDALAWLQWCGASGGAHGRRRGGAAGRFTTWWTLAALSGVPWPHEAGTDGGFADALGSALDELEWYRWAPDHGARHDGWHLHLAVHDPVDRLAWAVAAFDHLDDDAAGRTAPMPSA